MIPPWFTAALATTPEVGTVDVDDANINWLGWGDHSRPGLMLVHGGAAHAGWWSFIGPLLATRYRVVAIDLSGHGDSDWRAEYSVVGWADEVMRVASAAGINGRFVLVGHSMGGFVCMAASALHGDDLLGTVVVDAPVRRPDPESEEGARGRAFRNPKSYPDLATALRHFHLIPIQPVAHPYIIDHVGRGSLRPTDDDAWTWKFDPNVFHRTEPVLMHQYLQSVRCRVAVFYGELSEMATPDIGDYMSDLLGRTAPFVEIPQAYHHLILDQPLAFIAALRAILADWEHSVPKR